MPNRVAQSAANLAQEPEARYPVRPHTFVSLSADSRRTIVGYWRKYVHEVLVNRLGGLRLPRISVVRLTDRSDMTIAVYYGRTGLYNNTTTLIKYTADIRHKKLYLKSVFRSTTHNQH